MDALEYFKIRSRMTNNCNESCDICPLSYDNNSKKISCGEFESLYPNEAIKIVEEWGKEHPFISNMDKYKEIIRETFGDNFIQICFRENVPTCRCRDFNCSECEEFWGREYKKKEEE